MLRLKEVEKEEESGNVYGQLETHYNTYQLEVHLIELENVGPRSGH